MKKQHNIEDFSFRYSMNTRFIDMDAFQHINNAVYASYIESARVQMFSRWGIEGSNKGKSIIMASLKIDYIAQLKHPEEIVIGQKVSRVGKTSFDIDAVVFNSKNEPVCHALVVAVCFDFENQFPVEVYDSIKVDYGK